MTNRRPPKNGVQRAGGNVGPPSRPGDQRRVSLSGEHDAVGGLSRFEGYIEQRSGPLPDPGDLRAYREIDEGLFQAIVSDFQAEGELRREIVRRNKSLDEKVIPRLIWLDALGLILGASVVIFALHSLTLTATGSSDAAKIVAAFASLMLAIPAIIKYFRGTRVRIREKAEAEESK